MTIEAVKFPGRNGLLFKSDAGIEMSTPIKLESLVSISYTKSARGSSAHPDLPIVVDGRANAIKLGGVEKIGVEWNWA